MRLHPNPIRVQTEPIARHDEQGDQCQPGWLATLYYVLVSGKEFSAYTALLRIDGLITDRTCIDAFRKSRPA